MVAVVQLVEHQIVVLVVVGSSPIGHPIPARPHAVHHRHGVPRGPDGGGPPGARLLSAS